MDVVPPEVRAALAGRPVVGEWDPMFALLTVDDAGFPHVCLLGRAELGADESGITAVSTSPTTIANIRRDGKATLIVVGDDAVSYCKLVVAGNPIEDERFVAFRFALASIKRDGIGVALAAPKFLATQQLADSEQWATTARLLGRLAAGAADAPRSVARPDVGRHEPQDSVSDIAFDPNRGRQRR